MPNASDEPATQIITPDTRSDEVKLIPVLTVTTGLRVGMTYQFEPTAEAILTIGRTDEADLVIDDPTLSRVHARFTWLQVGNTFHMMLEDLKSTNGSRVNDETIDATYVKDGDQIQLGEVSIRFQCLAPAEIEEKQRLISKASEAEIDPLTGLNNRRFLKDSLPGLLMTSDSEGATAVVTMIDLDHFKGVNDTYGHGVGDDVLRTVSKLLREHLRDGDRGVRFGGEEFFAIQWLPASEPDPVKRTGEWAEELRALVEGVDTKAFGMQRLITVSIGISARARHEAIDKTIERADAALYRAKEGGRNRVEIG